MQQQLHLASLTKGHTFANKVQEKLTLFWRNCFDGQMSRWELLRILK